MTATAEQWNFDSMRLISGRLEFAESGTAVENHGAAGTSLYGGHCACSSGGEVDHGIDLYGCSAALAAGTGAGISRSGPVHHSRCVSADSIAFGAGVPDGFSDAQHDPSFAIPPSRAYEVLPECSLASLPPPEPVEDCAWACSTSSLESELAGVRTFGAPLRQPLAADQQLQDSSDAYMRVLAQHLEDLDQRVSSLFGSHGGRPAWSWMSDDHLSKPESVSSKRMFADKDPGDVGCCSVTARGPQGALVASETDRKAVHGGISTATPSGAARVYDSWMKQFLDRVPEPALPRDVAGYLPKQLEALEDSEVLTNVAVATPACSFDSPFACVLGAPSVAAAGLLHEGFFGSSMMESESGTDSLPLPVPHDPSGLVLNAAALAPTARLRQPWSEGRCVWASSYDKQTGNKRHSISDTKSTVSSLDGSAASFDEDCYADVVDEGLSKDC